MVFKNRTDAGLQLARTLTAYRGMDVVVYALPRGGVVLGAEVARYLNAPLALIIPRKIGHPLSPEYAIGAVTETGEPVWNPAELKFTNEPWRQRQVELARREAKRRRVRYQGDQPVPDGAGITAILVDDGIATGLTVIAAVRDLRKLRPAQIVVAVPVAPEDVPREIIESADDIVVLELPAKFLGAIGAYYRNFDQVSDEEVRQLMNAYRPAPRAEPLDLAALNAMLATVEHFPVTSGEIASRARRLQAPANVVSFFESIPHDTKFTNRADIMRRSEITEVLLNEELGEPGENLRSYDQ